VAGIGALVILLSLAACGSGGLLGPSAPQGIEGLVLLGPQCPVQTLDDPCPDLPYQAWLMIRRKGGDLVTRIRSDEEGKFRVGLPPGIYTLDPESGNPFPIASSQDVVVEKGRYAEVLVQYDTGIR
jgi:hypothetical protein